MNKEELRAYKKTYRQANSEKIKRYKKAYRKTHKEEIKAYNETYRKTNCEKLRAYDRARNKAKNKAYWKANPDKMKAKNKAYWKANPEKCRDYGRKRRSLKLKVPYESINDKRVSMRDGWICQICHKVVNKRLKYPNPMSASLDHITPLSKGGTHTYANVQLAHLGCNLSKQDGVTEYGEQLRLC